MYIKRFFGYFFALCCLAGCSTVDIISGDKWDTEYDITTAGAPIQLQYGQLSDGYGTDDTQHNIAVLLPLSGDAAPIGRTIRTSVETALVQRPNKNLAVTFYDTTTDLSETINTVLETKPEIIIGPIFANDAKIVRAAKPSEIPVLSFTSDATAIGDGVMTMALMPTNGVESIIAQMQSDNIKHFIVIAPDTASGHLMAGAAKSANELYTPTLNGIFFYKEKDTDSIKNTAETASMNQARIAAHTRARTVLSDIITNERLTTTERANLSTQLEKLEKTETLGTLPYDAILFLGDGEDTKSLASFLRYYDVGARDIKFYGTTMWDGSDIASDFTMSGARFPSLTNSSPEFSVIYEQISGKTPNHLAAFGYDAINMAIGMIYSDKTNATYLITPNGYIGTSGLYRLTPNGSSERALQISELNGTNTPTVIKKSVTDFTTPIYKINASDVKITDSMDLETPGIDPDDYIFLPEHLRDKYSSKIIGANARETKNIKRSQIVAFLPDEDSEPIKSENYKPIKHESISRTYIDEYEIEE